jgi:predicted phage tail protein
VLKFFDIFLPYEDKISSVEMIRALAVWSLSLPTRDVT